MSLLYMSISVTRPLFGFMYFMGAPVLALAFLWSVSNALHSGPVSVTFSSMTSPQLLQTYSPFSLSNMMSPLPQLGQRLTLPMTLGPSSPWTMPRSAPRSRSRDWMGPSPAVSAELAFGTAFAACLTGLCELFPELFFSVLIFPFFAILITDLG